MGIKKKATRPPFFLLPTPCCLSARSARSFSTVYLVVKSFYFSSGATLQAFICVSLPLSLSLSLFYFNSCPQARPWSLFNPTVSKVYPTPNIWLARERECVRECVWLCVFSFFSPGKIISFISKPNIARRLSVFALERRRRNIMTIPDCLHMKYIYPQSANLTNYLWANM